MTPTDASQVKNMCQCLRSRHIQVADALAWSQLRAVPPLLAASLATEELIVSCKLQKETGSTPKLKCLLPANSILTSVLNPSCFLFRGKGGEQQIQDHFTFCKLSISTEPGCRRTHHKFPMQVCLRKNASVREMTAEGLRTSGQRLLNAFQSAQTLPDQPSYSFPPGPMRVWQ